MSAAMLLRRAASAGLRLQANEGRLRIEAERAPDLALLAELRQHKAELLDLLAVAPKPSASAGSPAKPSAATTRASAISWPDLADTFAERAAIREHDSQRPRLEAEQGALGDALALLPGLAHTLPGEAQAWLAGGMPAAWCLGVAWLSAAPLVAGWPPHRWPDLQDTMLDTARSGVLAEAAKAGWTELDLAGCHPAAPYQRLDQMGLLPLLTTSTRTLVLDGHQVVQRWHVETLDATGDPGQHPGRSPELPAQAAATGHGANLDASGRIHRQADQR